MNKKVFQKQGFIDIDTYLCSSVEYVEKQDFLLEQTWKND